MWGPQIESPVSSFCVHLAPACRCLASESVNGVSLLFYLSVSLSNKIVRTETVTAIHFHRPSLKMLQGKWIIFFNMSIIFTYNVPSIFINIICDWSIEDWCIWCFSKTGVSYVKFVGTPWNCCMTTLFAKYIMRKLYIIGKRDYFTLLKHS